VQATPTPVDPVAAAEQAALKAYRCMWAAYDAAGRAPAADPDDQRLDRWPIAGQVAVPDERLLG
jgi:hypothetical protein